MSIFDGQIPYKSHGSPFGTPWAFPGSPGAQVNQIGSVTESIAAWQLCKDNKRLGEPGSDGSLVSKKGFSPHRDGAPPVITWLKNPVISTINHSYIYHKP